MSFSYFLQDNYNNIYKNGNNFIVIVISEKKL